MFRPFIIIFALLIHFQLADAVSFGVFNKSKFRGEKEFSERMKIAAKRLGWEVSIFEEDEYLKTKPNTYDFVLCLTPKTRDLRFKNEYLFLFDPTHHFFTTNGTLEAKYRKYAGYLPTYNDTKLLEEDLGLDGSRIYSKAWYPLVQYTPYRKVDPTCLFYFIGSWGNRLQDEKYQTLQHELSQKPYTRFFGNPKRGEQYGSAFKGSLPYDGITTIKEISQMGVCLVLHSDTHIKYEIPSGRIFEAVAASSVVISDRNPFVVKNFGDTVLYIDQNLSGEEISKAIDRHMNWIRENREEAIEMARKAHCIFEEKFLLESQLLDFYYFVTHESLKLSHENDIESRAVKSLENTLNYNR